MSYAHLLPPSWKSLVTIWLQEDTPSFDYGGFVVGEVQRTALLLGKGKETAVLAGVPFVNEIFAQLGCDIEWHMAEGETFEPIKVVATVTGKARFLLLGERVALNLLARCSGIATKSRRFRDIARSSGYKGIIAGTRKTTPGFRLVEKYGMMVGGIDAHRHDLSSMIMLKDNHIWSCGSISSAIATARQAGGFSLLLDVEVRTEAEADEAIEAGADVIMLDNMEGEQLLQTARRLREKWAGKRFLLETSGGIEENNLRERAVNGLDFLRASHKLPVANPLALTPILARLIYSIQRRKAEIYQRAAISHAPPFKWLLPAIILQSYYRARNHGCMAEILCLLSGIVHEILVSSPSKDMRSRKCLLPNTGPPYSLNSLSKPHSTIFLLLAFQLIWILAALQWGSSRIGQVLNGGTWAYFRDIETQVQIAIAFFYLCSTRWHPVFLSGITKHLPLTQAKQGLVKAISFLLIHDFTASINTPSVLDFALITTLFARFCSPQSTSLFTSPCRPFTSPFPQCQDLLHAPPTYVMTFWLVFFLLLAIVLVLDWLESGLPISRHFTQSHAFSTSTSTPSLLLLSLRFFSFLLCLNLAFGDRDPGPPHWGIKPALFSPTTPLEGWFFSVLIATTLAICASILRWAVVKVGAFSFLRIFSLLQNRSKILPNYYEIGLSSLNKAYSTTSRALSQPRDHPEKISKNEPKAYRCKRSPLTPHTFESPFSRQEMSELPLFSLDAKGPVDEAAIPVDLAVISATQMEMFNTGNVDGASLTAADFACSARDLLLEIRSVTPPLKGGMYLDVDEEDRFPLMRPTSRLGFNTEEALSRWNSARAFDGDSEMEGTASMLFRPSLQQGDLPRPLIYGASSSSWSHQLDLTLTPAHDVTPLSPCRTPSNHSSSSLSPPTPGISSASEDDCEDWDAFPLSPARVSYDWARAATFFSDSIDGEDEVEEVGKQRVFHLAQIPDLHTIEEETSDEEMEIDRDL